MTLNTVNSIEHLQMVIYLMYLIFILHRYSKLFRCKLHTKNTARRNVNVNSLHMNAIGKKWLFFHSDAGTCLKIYVDYILILSSYVHRYICYIHLTVIDWKHTQTFLYDATISCGTKRKRTPSFWTALYLEFSIVFSDLSPLMALVTNKTWLK